MTKDDHWDLHIKPQSNWLNLNFKETWRYRDLVLLFVKRDLVAQYKQTILGPLWYVLQPLLTTFIFTLIFGRIAKLGTDGSPTVLFILSGVVMWNFFSTALTGTSSTFTGNAHIFGKIYFPRLTIPLSVVISSMVKFSIQLMLLLVIEFYWIFFQNMEIEIMPNKYVLLLPILVIIVSLLSLGIGIIISSLTTKYRDFSMLIAFGVQLLMYLTPVVYPAVLWQEYQWIMDINPLSYVIEAFRYMFLGTGTINYWGLLYSMLFGVVFFLMGSIVFNKVDKSFMDTV